MEEKIRVMAIDNNIDVCEMLEAIIRSDHDLEWVGHAEDGVLALETVSDLNPDVILLDIIMPRLDGVALVEQLITIYPKEKPKIIMLSAITQQDIVRNLLKLGIDYYIVKPIDAAILITRIKQAAGRDLVQTHRNQDLELHEPEKDIEAHVAKLLFALRMPAYFKGYSYLKDAICMVVEDHDIHAPITVNLYTRIAKQHDTTPPVVEAAIRYAIRKTWKRGDPAQLKKLFGAFSDLNEKRVPTNSLFITRAAEEIKVSLLY
jgi:two-component system response regulator (stage 0 sporulation protein A)